MKEKQENKVMSNFDMYASQIIYDFKNSDNSLFEVCVTLYLEKSGHDTYCGFDVVDWLAKPYKEPIKVSKLWYEMMDYMYDMDCDYSQYTGKVNDYSFINAFIDFVPPEYRYIPLSEYLDRLEIE